MEKRKRFVGWLFLLLAPLFWVLSMQRKREQAKLLFVAFLRAAAISLVVVLAYAGVPALPSFFSLSSLGNKAKPNHAHSSSLAVWRFFLPLAIFERKQTPPNLQRLS